MYVNISVHNTTVCKKIRQTKYKTRTHIIMVPLSTQWTKAEMTTVKWTKFGETQLAIITLIPS